MITTMSTLLAKTKVSSLGFADSLGIVGIIAIIVVILIILIILALVYFKFMKKS